MSLYTGTIPAGSSTLLLSFKLVVIKSRSILVCSGNYVLGVMKSYMVAQTS